MSETKVCVLCGQSCAGQPRIKNAKGQYAHQSCAKKQAEQQAAASAPAAVTDADDLAQDDALMSNMLDDGLDDGMLSDALLGDLPSEPAGEIGGMQAACPGCGTSLGQGIVVCMSCGFDTRSGKAMKTKVAKQKAPKSGLSGVAAEAGSFALAGTTFLVGALIGSAAGGAIGAAVWAGIAIGTGWTIGYIALGVGVLAGLGAAIGSRGQTGMLTGLIAALVTLVAVPAGHYFAIKTVMDGYIADVQAGSLDTGSMFSSMSRNERFETFGQVAADQIAAQRLGAAEPDSPQYEAMLSLLDYGLFPDDYPADIVAEVDTMFDARSASEQADFVDAYYKDQRSLGFRVEKADEILTARLETEDLDDETQTEYQELIDFGVYPYMYPDDVVAEADAAWDALTPFEQDEYIQQQVDFAEAMMGDAMQAERQEAYASGFMGTIGVKMIIAFVFAIGIAYGVGSGGSVD